MRKILSLTLAFLLCLSMVAVAPVVLAADDYFIVDFTYVGYDKSTDTGKTDMYINQWWASAPTTFEGLQGTWIRPGNNMMHSVMGGGDCACESGKHIQCAAMCLANSQGQRYAIEAGKRYEIVYDLHFTDWDVTEGFGVAIDAIPSTEKVSTSAVSTDVYDYVGTASKDATIQGRSFKFTAAASGDIRLAPFNWASKKVWNNIYFANIKIRELPYEPASMEVDFSYSGYTHAKQGEKTWYKNTWGWATNPATIEATGTDSLWMRPSNNRLHNINSDTCMKGQYGPCLPNAGFRLVNSKGEAFKLVEGKKYRIKYDLYADFGNVTTEGFGVGIDAIPADKDPSSVPITEIAASNWHAQPTEPRLYDDVSFEFTAKTSGDARVYPFLYGWSELYMNIYFANISITELVEVNITVDGYIGDAEVPEKAYHNDTFESKLPKIDHVEWYLDEEYTVPATGAIGVKDVTVYAKVLPYIGIETPGKAGLFIGGKDLSSNAGIDEGVSDNSAVYEIDGEKYTAFRVFGSYVCPDVLGVPKTDEIVVGEGVSEKITSRHVILGYGDKEFSIDDCYVKTDASGSEKLANYWNATRNLDGSWTVTFSLLLKNIPEEYKSTEFKVKSAVVTESEEVIYSDQIVEGVSAQAIYEGISGEKPIWFN